MPQKSDFGLTGIPEILFSTEMKWLDVEGDRRGVINLSSLFPGNNTKASVFAKTIIMSDKRKNAPVDLHIQIVLPSGAMTNLSSKARREDGMIPVEKHISVED